MQSPAFRVRGLLAGLVFAVFGPQVTSATTAGDPTAAPSGPDWIQSLPEFPQAGAQSKRGPRTIEAPAAAKAIDVALWTEKNVFAVGDLIELSVSVSVGCHLTLIAVDGEGRALVIFPNELEPDNRIPAGVTLSIPGHEAGYQFRLDRQDAERFVAVCQHTRSAPKGIKFDFEKQRFTALGDWQTFLKTSAKNESTKSRGGEDKELTGTAALTIAVGGAPKPSAPAP
jgi:Domain of unknown function (DUF4384)